MLDDGTALLYTLGQIQLACTKYPVMLFFQP